MAWYAGQRYVRVAVASLAALAGPRDVEVRHPLAAPAFLTALAREGGAVGIGATRTDAMRLLFADVVPEKVLSRRIKAQFGATMWGPESRAFAASWNGAGVDPARVDRDRLRDAWRRDTPPFGSSSVLQSVWLSGREGDA